MATAIQKEFWIGDSSTKPKTGGLPMDGYIVPPETGELELFDNTFSPGFLMFDNDRSDFFRELLFEIVSKRVIERNRRLLLELSKY